MALTTAAIYLIGRIHPEIFDILGNPHGPYGHLLHTATHTVVQSAAHEGVEHSQTHDGLATGFRAGQDLLELARTATRLRVAFDPDLDDWCPTPPRPPWWWGPWPPGPRPGPWWVDYDLGFALFLEASQSAWERTDAAGVLEKAHDIALQAAQKGLAEG